MSNFMHKVKDAMSDPHDRNTGHGRNPNKFDDTRDTYGSSNPPTMNQGQKQYGSDPGMGSDTYGSGQGSGQGSGYGNDPQNTGGPTNTMMGNRGAGAGSDTYGSSAMGGDGPTNAGPHDSKFANKMDPRVDSDLGNRGQFAGNTGPQDTGGGARDFNPSNTASMQQPGNLGSDDHVKNEENYSSSTQEHKSQSTTKHAMPCQMDPQAQPGSGQQQFGGGATGGSSYGDNAGVRGPSGGQNPDPMNKLDPRVRRSNEQQDTVGNQRGGY